MLATELCSECAFFNYCIQLRNRLRPGAIDILTSVSFIGVSMLLGHRKNVVVDAENLISSGWYDVDVVVMLRNTFHKELHDRQDGHVFRRIGHMRAEQCSVAPYSGRLS